MAALGFRRRRGTTIAEANSSNANYKGDSGSPREPLSAKTQRQLLMFRGSGNVQYLAFNVGSGYTVHYRGVLLSFAFDFSSPSEAEGTRLETQPQFT